jgi:hypothetical protein
MCATCHEKTDERFPSTLKLGEKCKDCHGGLENAPAAWKLEKPRAVRVGEIRVIEGDLAAGAKVDADCRAALERRGFAVAKAGQPAEAELDFQIRLWRVREERFVAKSEAVLQAEVMVVVRPPSGQSKFRRRAVSRSFYGADPAEAGIAAARDAFRLLEGHLAEALKKG